MGGERVYMWVCLEWRNLEMQRYGRILVWMHMHPPFRFASSERGGRHFALSCRCVVKRNTGYILNMQDMHLAAEGEGAVIDLDECASVAGDGDAVLAVIPYDRTKKDKNHAAFRGYVRDTVMAMSATILQQNDPTLSLADNARDAGGKVHQQPACRLSEQVFDLLYTSANERVNHIVRDVTWLGGLSESQKADPAGCKLPLVGCDLSNPSDLSRMIKLCSRLHGPNK